MDKIKLSKLLNVEVTQLSSGSELMFVLELSKYCESLLDKKLDLSDITVDSRLLSSDYFGYVYSKGLNFKQKPILDNIDLAAVSRKFFNSDLSGVVFEKKTDKEWLYDYITDKHSNIVLNGYNRSGGYVSLYAYMVVKFYADKKPIPMLTLRNSSPKQEELEYVDLLILMYYGNHFLNGKVNIIFSKMTVNQPEWEAYIMYHRQMGEMVAETPSNEKYEYVKEHFNVNDVVLFYRTEKYVKSKSIRKLVSCFPAVITAIGERGIALTCYSDITTLLTKRRMLEEAEAEVEGYKWLPEDYSRFSVSNIQLDYNDIGVDNLFFVEDEMIMTPFDGIDTFEQYVVDKNGVEGLYKMGTLDTIYTVFCDRNVKFDKKSFLKKYFKDKKPIYDELMGN